MSRIYECLKKKAENLNNNYIFYTHDSFWCNIRLTQYTISDLYELVNKCIKHFKKINLTNQICFQIVNTSFEDIVTMIALLETGNKPILVNSDMLYDLYNSTKTDFDSSFKYPIIPSVNINEDGNISIPQKCLLDIRPVDKEIPRYNVDLKQIGNILQGNFNLSGLDNHNFDFALLTSGTTGQGKIFKIKENELISKTMNQYDMDKEETFIIQNPISAISGLLFSMYIPIIGNKKSVYVGNVLFTPTEKLGKHLNIILPGNYSYDNTNANKNKPLLSDEDGDNIVPLIDQITILGDRTNNSVIEVLHSALYNLPISKVFIYYGRTENMGLVSKINEKDMIPVYIYCHSLSKNKIIYSYNKKDVYEIEYINGKVITKRSDIKYNTVSFYEVLPIAVVNNPKENININSNIFGEIIADDKSTSDYGFKLDNRIYYLCRSNELLYKKNNDYCFVSAFGIKNLSSSFNLKNIKDVILCVNNDKVCAYISCETNQFKCDNYRKNNITFYNLLMEINSFGIKIDEYNLIDSEKVPYGREIGKLKRGQLAKYRSIINQTCINSDDKYINIVKSIISKELNRPINTSLENDYFIFSKSEFEDEDMAKILTLFRVFDYKDDSKNYYLVINDDFLFAKESGLSITDEDNYHDYLRFIKKRTIRDHLLNKYNLKKRIMVSFGFFHDKDGLFTGVVSAMNSKNVHDDYYYCNYDDYRDIIEKEFELYIDVNQYEIYHQKGYFRHEFKIDIEGNFYCDGKLVTTDYTTTEISRMMRGLLMYNYFPSKTKKKIK